MSRLKWLHIVAVFLLPIVPLTGWSQATQVDQISGTIQDSSGAVIPGARITALQTATGFSRSTVSTSNGSYLLASLPIGPYQITVTAEGFKTYEQKGIVLQVNTNPTVNAVLQIGAVSQQIEVQANAAMAETQTTAISQVIDERRVVDLPLNARDPTQLLLLSGAAVIAPTSLGIASSKNYPTSNTIAIAGGQANGTVYLLDGGDHNDAYSSINLPIPFPDSLQEFSVQTNAIPASYGYRAGGVVNIVTKSGANAFHGDLFEFVRNGAVNAINYFASSVDQQKRNNFGGTIGGPIKHDRLFFFGGYQGDDLHTAPPTTTSFVPTVQALQGNFTTLTSSTCGTPRTIKDPQTGLPFPGNQIPITRFNMQAVNFLQYIPVSNDPCGKLLYSIINNSDENQYLGRADWIQSMHHSLYGRYYYTGDNNPPTYVNKNLLDTANSGGLDSVQSFVAGDQYSIGSNAINAFHFTWTRERINRGPASGVPSASDLGLNVEASPGNSPQITVSNFFGTLCGTCALATVYSGTMQFADDFSLVRGRNQFEFGGEWIRRYSNFITSTQQDAAFTFNGSITGYAMADFLLGLPSSFVQGNLTVANLLQNYVGLYASDKVRFGPHLSLNLGLRWEPYLPEYDTQGRATHFDLPSFVAGTRSQIFQNAPPGLTFPGDRGFPRGGQNQSLDHFGPRLGLVWDPRGNAETVVRVGYGMLYDFTDMQYLARFGFGPPWASAITLNNPAGGFTNPYLNYPGGDPFPLPQPPKPNAAFVSEGQYINIPLNPHLSYFQQWNVSVQQQFGPDWLLSLNYTGNQGTHLWLSTEQDPATYIPGTCGTAACSTVANTNSRRILAQLNPQAGTAFSTIYLVDDGATSSYNSMLAVLNHRLAKGFSALLNYTWSHCMSEGSTNAGLTNSYQNPYYRNGDRGNCVIDERQIFNASIVASSPHLSGGWPSHLISDWELAPIITAHTGLWFTPLTGTDASLTGVGDDRPNVNGNANLAHHTLKQWFNTAAFTANPPGQYGDAGMNSLIGPGGYDVDMALSRNFPFHAFEKAQYLELRVEAFNSLNHPTFVNPGSTLSSSSTFGVVLTANNPRIMQGALKYVF